MNATHSEYITLISAIKQHRTEEALCLLEIPEVQANAGNDNNYSLRIACLSKHAKLGLRLLEIPAVRANAAAHNNITLISACQNNMPELALRLLEIEAVRANAAVDENIPLRLACKNKMPELALRLLEIPTVRANAEAHNNAALKLTYRNKIMLRVVLDLLEIPAVEAKADAYNNAALIFACQNNMSELALRLLEVEAVRAKAADGGNIALCMACLYEMPELALYLLAIPAVKNNAGINNNAALAYACNNSDINMVRLLLKEPAVKAVIANGDYFALSCACSKHHLEIINTLLSLPEVALDKAVFEQVDKINSNLGWYLAMYLLQRPEHHLSQSLRLDERINLQVRLCQSYHALSQQAFALILKSLPEDIQDKILSYLDLPLPLIWKNLLNQGKPTKEVLKSLTRSIIQHQALAVMQELSHEAHHSRRLSLLLKQPAMQNEIKIQVEQALKQEDRATFDAYLAIPGLPITNGLRKVFELRRLGPASSSAPIDSSCKLKRVSSP